MPLLPQSSLTEGTMPCGVASERGTRSGSLRAKDVQDIAALAATQGRCTSNSPACGGGWATATREHLPRRSILANFHRILSGSSYRSNIIEKNMLFCSVHDCLECSTMYIFTAVKWCVRQKWTRVRTLWTRYAKMGSNPLEFCQQIADRTFPHPETVSHEYM